MASDNDRVNLQWAQLPDGGWFPLFSMELEAIPSRLEGVYIIRASSKVLIIGHGDVRRKLTAHLEEANLQIYREQNIGLYVTWAQARPEEMEGIALFLTGVLRPANYKKSNLVIKNRVNIPLFKKGG